MRTYLSLIFATKILYKSMPIQITSDIPMEWKTQKILSIKTLTAIVAHK